MLSGSTSSQGLDLYSNANMNPSTDISEARGPCGTRSPDVTNGPDMVPPYPRATLLGLPPELRETIIEEVIFSRPALPNDILRRDYWDPAKGNDQSPHTAITYDLQSGEAFEPTALPLLLVNREIHDKTRNMLRLRKPRTGLEIAVIDNRWILPTWTYIPLRSQIVPEMDVICDNLHFGPLPRTDTLEHDMFNIDLILSRPCHPSPFRVQHLYINVDTGSGPLRPVSDSELPGRELSGPRCSVSNLGSIYTSNELPSFQGQNRRWSVVEGLNSLVSVLCSNHHGEGPVWDSTWCSLAETVGDLALTVDGASMGTWQLENTLVPKAQDHQIIVDLKRRSAHQRRTNGLGDKLLFETNEKVEEEGENPAA